MIRYARYGNNRGGGVRKSLLATGKNNNSIKYTTIIILISKMTLGEVSIREMLEKN